MKSKVLICCVLLTCSLSCIAQTALNFTYNCSNSGTDTTQALVCLKSANNEITLLRDTVSGFENMLTFPANKNEWILSVEFKNRTIGRETLNYPFLLAGNETEVEIKVRFYDLYNYWSDPKKQTKNGSVEIIKYYSAEDSNLGIRYLPKEKGNEYFKAPFFMLKNNSRDTIYGQYVPGYFWGSIRFLLPDSTWSRDFFGQLDMNFDSGSPLLPDSTTLAWVGSFGWRNELPENRYKYTLIYTTDKNTQHGISQHSKKDNFTWWAGTKNYYRQVFEFNVE
ncbi:MAG: hypothetical protein LBV74_13160 [Tannerella sp.]|jgi:hypothetical protein|nr:hypothetical protein [Tannerella sp.]